MPANQEKLSKYEKVRNYFILCFCASPFYKTSRENNTQRRKRSIMYVWLENKDKESNLNMSKDNRSTIQYRYILHIFENELY